MIGLDKTYYSTTTFYSKDEIDKMRLIEQRLLARKVKAWKWKNSGKSGRK